MTPDEISLCISCNCMTHTIDYKCGKCGAVKQGAPDDEYEWLRVALATQRHLVNEDFHSRIIADEKLEQQIISHIQQHYLSKHHAFTWYITTGLKQNGKVLLGPFATKDLALDVRKYMEIAEAPATYWVEQLHDYGNVQISNKENK